MNNRERAQKLADEHGNDAYSVALAMLDNMEQSRNLELRYESLIENGLICSSCGGSGFLGNLPDDYYDCPECARSVNKIKAEAVSEVAEMSFIDDAFTYQMIKAHAKKLENQND